MLAVRDAHVALGGHLALAGVDLDVAEGTVMAVLGPSGSGKSTLLRAIAGLQPLDRGAIELDGRSVRRALRDGSRQRIKGSVLPAACPVRPSISGSRWRPAGWWAPPPEATAGHRR